jgi:hypothetical protein
MLSSIAQPFLYSTRYGGNVVRRRLLAARPVFLHFPTAGRRQSSSGGGNISIPPLTPHTKALADQLLSKTTTSTNTNDDDADDDDDNSQELQRRFALSRAITLLESTNPQHAHDAEGLLAHLLHSRATTGTTAATTSTPNPSNEISSNQRNLRIGVAGPPGAGK